VRPEHWNIKINEGKIQAINFSKGLEIQLNGQDILFINNVIYLGVTFQRRMMWRLHIERTIVTWML
jgi:uncharacterized protein (AIM24 family)